MKIAIIGSGIAGLTAAWRLSQRFHVTLFEQKSRLGMAAHGLFDLPGALELSGGTAVDVPPRMFNPLLWPELTKLYANLGVEVVPADQSKSFSVATQTAYLVLGDSYKLSAWEIARWAMTAESREILSEIKRMRGLATEQGAGQGVNFGEYLGCHRFGGAFVSKFLFPALSSTVCTCSYEALRAYPASVMLEAMQRIVAPVGLQRTRHGTSDVVTRLSHAVPEVCLNSTVEWIRDSADEGVVVETDSGTRIFDHVIVATQANRAAELVVGAPEAAWLKTFQYESVATFVHTDIALMPQREKDWASFNIISTGDYNAAMCSIWMNRFVGLESAEPIIQSIMPIYEPQSERVLHRSYMQRPVVTEKSVEAAQQLSQAQQAGGRKVWFCGSYLGEGVPLLESGVVSALAVAEVIEDGSIVTPIS